MPLETATTINQLVSTNPASTDGLVQGDDHIRLIKSTLLATFPNITGAVTATHTVINGLDGRLTAVESGKLSTSGGTVSGALTVSGLVSANAGLTATAPLTFPAPTESAPSIAEIATQAEVATGTDDVRYVTPLKLTGFVPTTVTIDRAADFVLVLDATDNKVRKVTAASASGILLQSRRVTTSTYQTFSTSTNIPIDDTVPTSSEGNQLLTDSITLSAAANRVRVSGIIHMAAASAMVQVVSVFRGTTCIGVSFMHAGGAEEVSVPFDIIDTPGSVGPHTYSIRVGNGQASSNTYINGRSSTRLYGGVLTSHLALEEYLP